MEKKFKVYSTLAGIIVCTGSKKECEDYKKLHESIDNSMYILTAEV